MSVFGGDSWRREAQYRKRRVDDVLIEGLDVFPYKKLSSGKYACLFCPHNPILDSPLMLSTHCKGSRHIAAESRLKERELMRKDEIDKILELSDFPVGSMNSTNLNKKVRLGSKPLIEQTMKALLLRTSDASLVQQQLEFEERRERKLKFIEAGWKRDCHGKWFKDENMSFLLH
ncbi:conserved hypothetical protein [Ricinus communis]|uniref:Sodium channel modifier 1 zinc-finger domain-containing protein n=1 Tax=Ricinus communis TaxID=3988 RepID=B9S784_RICCO|nr:conserved hypothetical protein [Ricinus communis]